MQLQIPEIERSPGSCLGTHVFLFVSFLVLLFWIHGAWKNKGQEKYDLPLFLYSKSSSQVELKGEMISDSSVPASLRIPEFLSFTRPEPHSGKSVSWPLCSQVGEEKQDSSLALSIYNFTTRLNKTLKIWTNDTVENLKQIFPIVLNNRKQKLQRQFLNSGQISWDQFKILRVVRIGLVHLQVETCGNK